MSYFDSYRKAIMETLPELRLDEEQFYIQSMLRKEGRDKRRRGRDREGEGRERRGQREQKEEK